MSEPSADFFVSYTGEDQRWAEWIAWQLEQADFRVVIQAWDFRPGNNFVVEMNRAASAARRTILVVSAAALASDFVRSEWAAAFAQDPTGIDRKLIPVRVEECDIEGLLGPVVYVDLVGKDGDQAVRALISGVEPGRSKPSIAPDFPGVAAHGSPPAVGPSAGKELRWASASGLEITRLADLDPSVSRGYLSVVEVHLMPAAPQLIPVSTLSNLGNQLADVGRAGGMFSATSALELVSNSEHVAVRVRERREDDTGLLVTRTGQRSAWLALPRDGLGSVLDAPDLTTRIAGVLRVLAKIDLPQPDRYAPVVAVGALMTLTVGDSSLVGKRSSASMRVSGTSEIESPLEDSFPASSLSSSAVAIAAELVARLTTRL